MQMRPVAQSAALAHEGSAIEAGAHAPTRLAAEKSTTQSERDTPEGSALLGSSLPRLAIAERTPTRGCYPRPVLFALTALAAFALGAVLGWGLRGRAVSTLALERERERHRIRASVLPVLERRASALSIQKERRSEDPLEGAVEVAAAIQAAEEKLVLPFTDTLEISRTELAHASEPPQKHRA